VLNAGRLTDGYTTRQVQCSLSPNSTCTICCGFVVQFLFLTGPLTNISTILATYDDNFDVLAACCTTDVTSAVAMLYLHTAATVRSYKRVSVTRIKFIDVFSCIPLTSYEKINKICYNSTTSPQQMVQVEFGLGTARNGTVYKPATN